MARTGCEYRFFEGEGFPASWKKIPGAAFKTDFRVWLRHAHNMSDEGLPVELKTKLSLSLCYERFPATADPAGLMAGIAWFSGCGESDRTNLLHLPEAMLEDIALASEARTRDCDLFWDYRQLWASFKKDYGIDLYRESLHWWAFRSLLEQLSEDSALEGLRRLRNMTQTDMKGKNYNNLFWGQKMAALPEGGTE